MRKNYFICNNITKTYKIVLMKYLKIKNKAIIMNYNKLLKFLYKILNKVINFIILFNFVLKILEE